MLLVFHLEDILHLGGLLFKSIYFQRENESVFFVFNEGDNRTSVTQTTKILKVVFERPKLGSWR